MYVYSFLFQAEDGIRDAQESRGLGDVYKETDDNVSSILITSSGDVWIGGDYGVSKYSGSTWTTYVTSDGLGSNRITNLTEVSNGDIWISDFNGATHYDGSTFTAYSLLTDCLLVE